MLSDNPVRRRAFRGTAMLPLLLCSSLPAGLPPDNQPLPCTAHPAPLCGFSDQGIFYIYVNEDRVATINFKWKTDGTFINKRTLSLAGQDVTASLRVVPDSEGRWTRIPMETPLGKILFVREGDVVRKTFRDTVETIDLKPGVLLFENFAPALMTQAVRQYDTAQGGKQSFPILILPKAMMDATLELKDKVERSVSGRDFAFTRYVYGLPGVDITLWVDDSGKLYFADVPAQHAAYVRDGFESLLRAPEMDLKLSQPTFSVKEERGISVPMRDGANLATDIYRPDAEGRFPVILARTPYKKETVELEGRYYARRGYVFAAQDCRGRFESPGEWEPFVHEPADGFDSVEWAAAQPWSTGKVGMCGSSYLAWAQWWAAGQNPPHLVTIIPATSPPDPFFNLPYEHGVFFLNGAIAWAEMMDSNATSDLSGAAMSRIQERKYSAILRSLPVIDLDKTVLGKENSYWRQWISHPVNDAYWEQASVGQRLKDVRIPVFHQSGWFDEHGIGTKLNYAAMAGHGHRHQKLVLGPWGHYAARRYRDRDFGPDAVIDLQSAYLRWFDRWLKGDENGVAQEPLVNVFVMGSNKWLHANTYPLPQTRFEKWYLTGGGRANTSWGNGRLGPEPPRAGSPPDRYTYDPGDPTPNPLAYEEPEDATQGTKSQEQKKKEADSFHESVTRERQDILVYTSDKLKQPLTFAGPLQAVLYASSSAKDTDWFVRLMEVNKEGRLVKLGEGKVRARFRQSTKEAMPLEPGNVYEYTIDLWQTGITILPGHRLRVEVASASFPTWSRNLNTGGHNETETEYVPADQIIYHDAQHPSHVLLPVIPDFE